MAGNAPATYRVTVPAEPDGLEHLHGLFDRARRDWPAVDGTDFDLLETAIIELAGNVARHGRPTGATDVTLSISVHEPALEATLVDAGARFDVDLDTVDLPPEMEEAGRGIAMARMAVDELGYDHVDGVNTWHLLRKRRDRG
jgi:serine/threonine-protein kinase RsbW